MAIDVNIDEVNSISPVPISQVDNIAPVTIARISEIAPAAIHVKELNQIDPLTVESLCVDRVTNLDPLHVDRLNVTRLPVVNLSVNQVPEVALGINRLPPVAIAIQQSFDMPSDYTARAQLLGFEVLRVRLTGTTRVVPRDCARREQAHTHDRSFPDVAAAGNPAIPSRLEERCAETVSGPPPLTWGRPRFAYGR